MLESCQELLLITDLSDKLLFYDFTFTGLQNLLPIELRLDNLRGDRIKLGETFFYLTLSDLL